MRYPKNKKSKVASANSYKNGKPLAQHCPMFFRTILLCLLALNTYSLQLLAQTVAPSGADAVDPNTPTPVADKNRVIQLDPFNITSTSPRGYMATNSASGTGLNSELKDLPMSISVVTSELLKDMRVTSMAEALAHTSSVTKNGRDPANNQATLLSLRGFPVQSLLLDGVSAGNNISTALIDRIELVRGPNTIYGASDPGGLINIISKRPLGRDTVALTMKAGDRGLFGGEIDANKISADGKLAVRIIGSHLEDHKYAIVDGIERELIALIGSYRLGQNTKLELSGSLEKIHGIASQRPAYSFEIIPTDLNGDGKIDNTNVGGVVENTARYNSSFLPRNYTSQTNNNKFDVLNRYYQVTLRHKLSEHIDLQYLYNDSYNNDHFNFREYNTFSRGANPALPSAIAADANHTYNYGTFQARVHTLQGVSMFNTGNIEHRLLVGGRLSDVRAQAINYALRAKGSASESAALARMIASGRNIRLFLTKDEVLNGVKYWLDDVPTTDELLSLGTRLNNVDFSENNSDSIYMTDSASFFENRLKVLGGLRWNRIRGQSTDIVGKKIGLLNDASKLTYQAGGMFALTPHVGVFVNSATSFQPNIFNANTGAFYSPQQSTSYESGFKFDGMWGGRLSGSAAVFDITRENVVRTDYNPTSFRFDLEVTDENCRGVEFEIFFNPIKNWENIISYTHLDPKVINSRTAAQGLRLESAAPNKVTYWTSYTLDNGPLTGLRIGGGFIVARGPIQAFGTSGNRLIAENGYTDINLFARYSVKVNKQEVVLGINVNNLNDVTYINARAGLNNPREISFSVSTSF